MVLTTTFMPMTPSYILNLIYLILVLHQKKNNLCISDIRTWMIKNKLKINDSKTEFLVLSSSFFKQQFNDLQINVCNTEINPSLSARNIRVIFDSHLNLESHINSVCRSAYFHLRNIRSIRNMLTDNACSQLKNSCFGYCSY